MADLVERDVGIEGIDKLWWIKGDDGAFTGPLGDWLAHRDDFLEHVKEKGIVIQAGGCCGMYPRFYAKYFKEVYTVEPHPDNYECLAKNCDDEPNILYGQYALGANAKYVSMISARPGGDDINMGMHRVNDRVQGDIPMITIDMMGILDKVDLIHLDLEGYEESALRGAAQLIQRDWPVIITEREGGGDFLIGLGYEAVTFTKMDTIFVKKGNL